MEEFDDKWIEKFEQTQTLKIFYFYIDINNTLHRVNQEIIEVNNGILTKDEIVKLIIKNKKKHKLINILTYIITEYSETMDYKHFLKSIKLNDINVNNSQKLFESINNVYFIFKEQTHKKLKQNTTKKVIIHSHRNTRRKALKANSLD